MLKSWTISRAAGAGSIAALGALLAWPAYAAWPDRLLLPFTILLAVAGLCGVSILWITIVDLAARRARGDRLRAFRVFDVAMGLVLAVPSLVELRAILPIG